MITNTWWQIAFVFIVWVREESSLMASTLISFWLTFLLYSALSNNPDTLCNQMINSEYSFYGQMFINFVFTWMVLLRLSTTVRSDFYEQGYSKISHYLSEENDGVKNNYDDILIQVSPNEQHTNGNEHYVFPLTKQTLLFQLVLMLSCCHYSMVFTNWGDPIIEGQKISVFQDNMGTYLLKTRMRHFTFFAVMMSQLLFCSFGFCPFAPPGCDMD